MTKSNVKTVKFLITVGIVLSGLLFSTDITAAVLKKVVAFSRFENKTSITSEGALDFNNGMADQLTDALIQSGQFVVLERQTLGDVIKEQDMQSSDRFQKGQSVSERASLPALKFWLRAPLQSLIRQPAAVAPVLI